MELVINNEINEPSICLNMIVKNESKIITRLFDSVIDIIDTYCICDTGSKDNTISLIKEYFDEKNIKGKIIESVFINFEINRNIALKSAKGMADYILLMDADMFLEISNEFHKKDLTKEIYSIQQSSSISYYNTRIISDKIDVNYKGVTHEYINIETPNCRSERLFTLSIRDIGDGGSKSNKYQRDIELLTKEVETNPNDSRSLFYLANSYYCIKENKNAIKYYQQHAKLVTWNEEEFYNYYRQGLCYKELGDYDKMANFWIKAWTVRPTRVESLYELIHYYRCNSQWNYCKLYYEMAKKIAYPINDTLFIHKDIYEYKLLYEYSIFAYYIGERNIHNIFTSLMNIKDGPDIYNLFNNYKFYCLKLKSSKVMKFIDEFERKHNNETYNFRSSTPSIIQYKGAYAMNLRYVNYNITPLGRYESVKNIMTINKFIELNHNFEILTSRELDTLYCDRKYEGIQDIKLINNNGQIKFTGTAYKINNKIGVVGGDYNCYDLFIFNEYTIDNEETCEKNWVYIPDSNKMVYKWYPLQIGELIDNKLINLKSQNIPKIFSMARGSTNGFKYNNEIWFIIHIVHQNNGEPRYYYHMFVKFDIDMNLLQYTSPFKFSDEPIEYCCGLIIEEERIIVSHSVWDRESYIKCYEKTYIEELFINF